MKMKSVENYLIKNFVNSRNTDEKIFSIQDLLLMTQDKEFLKRILRNFSKTERFILINTLFMDRVERYVYGVYFNHYKRRIKNRKEKKPISRLSSIDIKNYIRKYFPNYHFRKNINVDKIVKKLKNKAYYDVQNYKLNKEINYARRN